jgi:hypothetical protein
MVEQVETAVEIHMPSRSDAHVWVDEATRGWGRGWSRDETVDGIRRGVTECNQFLDL